MNSSGLGISSISEFRKQIISKKQAESRGKLPPIVSSKRNQQPGSESSSFQSTTGGGTKFEMSHDPESRHQVRFSA